MNEIITILQFPNKQLQTWYRLSYDQSLMLFARPCGTWSSSCPLLLHQQRVENFKGYLLTRSAVAWCSTDEVQDGITLERVSTRPVSPRLDWVHRVTSVVIVYSHLHHAVLPACIHEVCKNPAKYLCPSNLCSTWSFMIVSLRVLAEPSAS
jgi:hypothetical protein